MPDPSIIPEPLAITTEAWILSKNYQKKNYIKCKLTLSPFGSSRHPPKAAATLVLPRQKAERGKAVAEEVNSPNSSQLFVFKLTAVLDHIRYS